DDAALLVDDLALARRRLRPQRLDDRRVVAVGHEADLHALGLVGGGQAERAGTRAHLLLVERADREARRRELRGAEVEEEVRLVLRGVRAAQQAQRAARRIARDARVVAGGDRVGAERAGARQQARELEAPVAGDARDRRAAREVGVGE